MIRYKNRGYHFWSKLFALRGSVFPTAFAMALPSALTATSLRIFMNRGQLPWLAGSNSVVVDSAAWSGFSVLVGFLVVFRTSQAFARYTEGTMSVFRMRAEWFDACSQLIAFCKMSKATGEQVWEFRHLCVRLFSMLHAIALGEIEDSIHDDTDTVHAFNFELVDVLGVDSRSLAAIKVSDTRLELICQWIQQMIVEHIDNGVLNIPPPIISRVFQELSNGMVAVNDAIRVSSLPFPFPYAQACDTVLVLHWFLVPVFVSTWVMQPAWSFVLCFLQVFLIWCLNFIAVEIENPFGQDACDLDSEVMQIEMNRQLMLLMNETTIKTPRLSDKAIWNKVPDWQELIYTKNESFITAWTKLRVREKMMTQDLVCSKRPGITGTRRKTLRDPLVDIDDEIDEITEEGQGKSELADNTANCDQTTSDDVIPSNEPIPAIFVMGNAYADVGMYQHGDSGISVSRSCRSVSARSSRIRNSTRSSIFSTTPRSSPRGSLLKVFPQADSLVKVSSLTNASSDMKTSPDCTGSQETSRASSATTLHELE